MDLHLHAPFESAGATDESPTPTPANTGVHTPVGSPWLSPRLSGSFARLSTLTSPLENTVIAARKTSGEAPYRHLALYLVLNLLLTISNKVILARPGISTFRDRTLLVAFSLVYTLNIAASNVSLNLVTIPLHQIIRATTPLFTVAIAYLWDGEVHPPRIYLSLLPVIIGVCLATYGDYHCTPLGFAFTLFGAFIAALKGVITNRIQTRTLRLSALELLFHMSPLAMVQSLLLSHLTGETTGFLHYAHHRSDGSGRGGGRISASSLLIFSLIVNGSIAFALNVVSFTANKQVGALTMTVVANIKQILTIVLGLLLFRLRVEWMTAYGIGLTLLGAAWYAKEGLEVNGPSTTTTDITTTTNTNAHRNANANAGPPFGTGRSSSRFRNKKTKD
ncbi:MAG: UAA transporter, partial [Phylliscum demangeonii]